MFYLNSERVRTIIVVMFPVILKHCQFKGIMSQGAHVGDFHGIYTIKPFWVDDFKDKIKTCYFNSCVFDG